MIRLAALAAGLAALLGLAGCASLSEDACRAGDWEGIGFRDGAAGRSEARLADHAEACAKIGVTPDAARWRAGRAEGLKLYCTQANAFDLGTRGDRLAPVCPAAQASALARANERGLRAHDLDREIDRIDAEIAARNRDMDKLLDGEVDRKARRLIRAYREEIARAERTRRVLERERAGYARPV